MIEYKKIEIDYGNRIGLMVRGHAHYAKKGNDIVCASVSSICQAAANGCLKFGEDTDIKHCRPGHFVFVTNYNPSTEAIIDTAFDGIENIAKQYPKCFKNNVATASE